MSTMTSSRTGARIRFAHAPGFWVIAAAFLTTMAFSTIPTPLYAIYQQRDGFPTFVITVIFASYAVGVMASLYLAGHVSDWLGRRRVALLAVLAEALSAAIFLIWPAVPGLLLARFICGVGVGVLTATATAHLSELRQIARPGEDPSRSALISSMVNLGGLAFGPLVGGVLAQYVAAPLERPYEIFLVLLLLSAVGIALVPETVERLEERPAYRPQRVALPSSARPLFFASAIGAFAAFAIFGLFTSLAPTFLAGVLHHTSRLLAGVVTFAVFIAGAASQAVFVRLSRPAQLRLGLVAMSVGLVGVAAGGLIPNLFLFVVGGIVAGAGVGLVFRGAVATAASLADPSSRGEVLAALFLIAYAGLAIPVLAIGLGIALLPAEVALLVFSGLILVLVNAAVLRMLAAQHGVHASLATLGK
ncbi:MFS transporter [Kribbella shirazensis]|uniref:Na+/melibiose symporter-like transporter n=1 Tax=Kribbella shirazensis TaxID=1105143 RepID=A0A7X5V6M6_9ACTN|nr:MFS transporter [Kribbella shirazensis]NIK55590.1 Na+/melibiose symporter-like transporter [Kribbella shirazensis]